MTYRESCGTLRGCLDHQASAETLCGFCAQAEAIARVAAEGVPVRPAGCSDALAPLTAVRQSANRNVLLAALDGFSEDHQHASDDRYAADELARRRAAKGAA